MGVRLLSGVYDGTQHATVMVDSVTGQAFGPLFASQWEAEEFCAWLPRDARTFESAELVVMFAQWRGLPDRAAQEVRAGE